LNGLTCIARGEFASARRFLERGLQLYDPSERGRHAAFTLYDPQIMMQIFLAGALFDLGYIGQARQQWQAALAQARQSKQPFTLPFALTLFVMAELSADDFDNALRGSEELVAHSEEHGVSFFWGIGTIFHGRSLVARGDVETGLQQLEQGLVAYRRTHGTLWLPTQLAMIADAYGKIGQPAEGLRRLDEAASYVARAGDHYAGSPVWRVRGELLSAVGDGAGAEACLREALAIARRQGGKSLELRAALSLAQLWQTQGKRAEARELLQPIYDWFTEGLAMPLHQAAKALLDTLAA
jgi:tetratricopeptide (TPR) repeat protein